MGRSRDEAVREEYDSMRSSSKLKPVDYPRAKETPLRSDLKPIAPMEYKPKTAPVETESAAQQAV